MARKIQISLSKKVLSKLNFWTKSWQEIQNPEKSSKNLNLKNLAFQFQIQEQLRALKKSTQDCGVEVERTRQLQETHSINFYKHHQISGRD